MMPDDEALEENDRSSLVADCQQVCAVPASIEYIDSYLWQLVCVCVCVCACKYSCIHLHTNVKLSVCTLQVIGICLCVFSTCFM